LAASERESEYLIVGGDEIIARQEIVATDRAHRPLVLNPPLRLGIKRRIIPLQIAFGVLLAESVDVLVDQIYFGNGVLDRNPAILRLEAG
jgi:hypothetical protein